MNHTSPKYILILKKKYPADVVMIGFMIYVCLWFGLYVLATKWGV